MRSQRNRQNRSSSSSSSSVRTTGIAIAVTAGLLGPAAAPGQEAGSVDGARLATLGSLQLEVSRQAAPVGLIDLRDFAATAQRGLDFMAPGARAVAEGHVAAAPVAGAVEERLVEVLEQSHADLAHERDPAWARELVAGWRESGARAAQVEWQLVRDGEAQAIASTAVFDTDSRVLYDTVLAGFIADAGELVELADEASDAQGGGGAVKSTSTDTATGTYKRKVGGLFGGSVDLKVRVVTTAQVAPYIEASTNNAHLRVATNEIRCWRANGSGISPEGTPKAYFGTGGRYADIYRNARPFKSTVRLAAASDSFQSGTYTLAGDDGRNWELSFSVGVQAGPVGAGIGITPSGGGPCLLSARAGQVQEITLENRVYFELIKGYRGVFPDGGSLELRNFALRTGDGPGEIGTCQVSLPVQMAYTTFLGTVLTLLSPEFDTLRHNVQYVRGDHLLRPAYAIALSAEAVAPGEQVIATVTVTNPSLAAGLKEGTVTLDVGSLGGKLEVISASSLPLGAIGTGASGSYEFVLQAVETGRVSPQVEVQGLWESPIPRSVTFEGTASAASPLVIGGKGSGFSAAKTFELAKGSAALDKTGLWGLKASGMYLPGRAVYEADLAGLVVTVDGVERFRADQGRLVSAKLDRSTGRVAAVTLRDAAKSSLTLDLKKGKLKLTLRPAEGLDPTDEVSIEVALAGTTATLVAPGTLVGTKGNKAVLTATAGQVR